MPGFSLYDAILGTLNLRQVVDAAYETNPSVVTAYESAGLDPQQLYGGAFDPRFSFGSVDIATICGASGIDPQAGHSVTTGMTVPFRLAADQGAYATGASHFAKSCTNGLVVVDSIDVDQQGNVCTARLMAHCRSTNGLDPVTPATGQSLAAQAFIAQFGMGKVLITPTGAGAVEVDAVGFSVSPGIQMLKAYKEGLPAPVRVNIRRRTPTIDVRFRSVADLVSFTASYKGFTAVSAYARRWKDAESFELDPSLVHAKFSFAGGISAVQTLRGSGTDDAEVTLRLHGKALTWSVTNAIP